MFITTANFQDNIPLPLQDRMEIIKISGYTEYEKVKIAQGFLVPKQIKANGLKQEDIKFSQESILKIIRRYTREAGVRNLEREIGNICRKVANFVALGKKKLYKITSRNLEKFAGVPHLFRDQMLEESAVGVATGMAWTPYGGDVLFIEVKLIPGKGNLIMTGSLGDVMKESAIAALSFIKANASQLSIPLKTFEKNDIHIHIPEGGIPKDGPSAGITLLMSLLSAFTGVAVNREIAMTGEVTLRGRILPVGGIKEKVLAAKRAGIRRIILPEKNKKDLQELKHEYIHELEFIFVDKIKDAVNRALLKPLL